MNLKSVFAASVAAIALVACAAPAAQTGTSNISVRDAWARPAIPTGDSMAGMDMGGTTTDTAKSTDSMGGMEMGGGGMSAAYMVIENKGTAADTLLSVTGDVAGSIGVHETKDNNGVMSMQEMKNGLDIPANGSVELKPASYHIMIMGLKKELKAGDTFKLTLKFKSGKELPVDVTVRDM